MCLGGHLAFRAAFDHRVLAAVCFFGTDIHSETLGKGGSDSLKRVKDIKGELVMIFGKKVRSHIR
jgi:carboxymethylenebutenolidase